MKCDNCDKKGMCAHAVLTHDDNGEMISINKNGRDVQAKLTMNEHEIVLEVEGDMFVITKDNLE